MADEGQLLDAIPQHIAPAATEPPPPPVIGAPKAFCRGLMSRRFSEAQQPLAQTRIKSFVYELDWAACQPNSATDTIPAGVVSAGIAALDYGAARGWFVRFRPSAGLYAPTWAKSIGGAPLALWSDDTGVGGTTGTPKQIGTVGRFWTNAYMDAYAVWQNLMAAAFGDHPSLADVTIAGTMTQYDEPLQRKWRVSQNRDSMLAANYTSAEDFTMTMRSLDIHHAAWSPKGVASSFAYTPWNQLDLTRTAGWFSDWPKTQQIMDRQRSVQGRFCLWQNNSLRDPADALGPASSPYGQMYTYMRTAHTATTPFPMNIGFQTATVDQMMAMTPPSTVDGTTDMAAAWGASFLEMPGGAKSWLFNTDPAYSTTQAECDNWNTLFAANLAAVTG